MSEDLEKKIELFISQAKPVKEVELEVLSTRKIPSPYKEKQTLTPNYNALADYFTIHYLFKDEKWYRWDGKRLEQINRNIVESTVDKELREAGYDLHQRAVSDIVTIIRRRVTVEDKLYGSIRLDEDGDVARINCDNCILVVDRTDEEKLVLNREQHDKKWRFTKVLPAAYIPEEKCEEFLKFLKKVMPDKEDQRLFRILAAYSLIDDPGLQVLLLLLGVQDTGKSTLLGIFPIMFGSGNRSSATLKYLSDFRGRILDKVETRMVNFSTEVDKIDIESVAALNMLISGEGRINDIKHEQERFVNINAKIFTGANIIPRLPGGIEVDALIKRIRLIVMNTVIPKSEIDRKIIRKKLAKEKNGILAWIVKGLDEALKLTVAPTGGKASTERYNRLLLDMNPGKFFLDTCCERKGYTNKTKFETLYITFIKHQRPNEDINEDSMKTRMWRYFAAAGIKSDRIQMGGDRERVVHLSVKDEWQKTLLPPAETEALY